MSEPPRAAAAPGADAEGARHAGVLARVQQDQEDQDDGDEDLEDGEHGVHAGAPAAERPSRPSSTRRPARVGPWPAASGAASQAAAQRCSHCASSRPAASRRLHRLGAQRASVRVGELARAVVELGVADLAVLGLLGAPRGSARSADSARLAASHRARARSGRATTSTTTAATTTRTSSTSTAGGVTRGRARAPRGPRSGPRRGRGARRGAGQSAIRPPREDDQRADPDPASPAARRSGGRSPAAGWPRRSA